MALLETQWIQVQQKTFTKWLNSKLKLRELAITDLVKDLSSGVSHARCFRAMHRAMIDYFWVQ